MVNYIGNYLWFYMKSLLKEWRIQSCHTRGHRLCHEPILSQQFWKFTVSLLTYGKRHEVDHTLYHGAA